MHMVQATASVQPPTNPQLAVSWATFEMPYPAAQADQLAVSWAEMEIQS